FGNKTKHVTLPYNLATSSILVLPRIHGFGRFLANGEIADRVGRSLGRPHLVVSPHRSEGANKTRHHTEGTGPGKLRRREYGNGNVNGHVGRVDQRRGLR